MCIESLQSTVLSALARLITLIQTLQQPYEVRTIVIPVLQMRKLRLREVKGVAQSHTCEFLGRSKKCTRVL